MKEKFESVLQTNPPDQKNHPIARNPVPFVPCIQEHRERVAKAQSTLTPAKVPYIDLIVPLSTENVRIPVRIYLPKQKITGLIPTLFYFPGTGFIANERVFTQVVCSHLCQKAQCQIIEIRNRLAPENPFPIGFQDAYEVFTYFATQFHQYYHIDRERIAIAGYSSGGNFAALVAIKAAQEAIFIRRQILISPMVDLSRSLKTFIGDQEKDTVISESFMRWIIELYAPESVNLKDPAISPFWQSKSVLQKLPPTDIVVGEWDRTRSDAELYYDKLKNSHVRCEKFLAPKQDHSYLWYNPDITEKISERVLFAFKSDPIDPIFHQHHFYFIKNRLEETEETNLTAPLVSKAKL